jgi:hypothetical protein
MLLMVDPLQQLPRTFGPGGSIVSLVLVAVLATVGLFILMLAGAEAGRRLGVARLARDSSGLAKGSGSAEAAVFALFGLLVAFTFSGAASRFEGRRDLIVNEANAIDTAYLRLDLLPSDAQPTLRELFREYADNRYRAYRQAEDAAATEATFAETAHLQSEIWTMSVTALESQNMSPSRATLVLGALNEMIDITATREMATRNHPPVVVFLLLGSLSIVCSLLVGYATSQNAGRSWLHTLTFAAIISLTVYVIVDLEFPRVGLIRVDSADDVLLEVRENMR